METAIKLCAIIPAYNPPGPLTGLVERLVAMNLPVILIDDGSTAECRHQMRDLSKTLAGVRLEVHKKNSGKGAAVKTGLRLAEQEGFSHALQIDADGQHNVDDIPRFITCMNEHPQALIAGYPLYDESVPKHRYYGRYITHIWIWINTLSTTIVDSMCGFRIYPVKASNQVLMAARTGDRMDFDSEFIVRWYWSGQGLEQLETQVIYPEEGLSHFRLLKDNLLISWMHTRLFFGMLIRLPKLLLRKRKQK